MQPQGQSPINEAYFAAQQAAFAACKLCAELQAQVDEVFASLQATQTAIEEQIAALLPMQVLLEIPTSPAQAVTWIQNFITTYLAPGLAAYNTYIAQLAALATQVADLITAIQNAEAQIEGCTITIPPLT